jgi:ABC-type Fe3+-hydroxamate transport system substrate-binding protein
LEKSLATQRQKEQEAEETLAEFKTKMEETSKKMFDDAKIQVLLLIIYRWLLCEKSPVMEHSEDE